VVKYGASDDRRASDYDLLLAAEAKAQKGLKGIYGKKDGGTAMHHVVDITGVSPTAPTLRPPHSSSHYFQSFTFYFHPTTDL
jgi:hypothetical protein